MSDYARVPDGIYTAKPVPVELETGEETFCQLGLAKKKGTKQVLVIFEIQDGPFKGNQLPWFGYLTEDSAKRTIDSLKTVGWDGLSFADLPAAILDGVTQVTVENQTFEGKMRSRVAWVGNSGGPRIVLDKQLDSKGLGSLDKTFGVYLGKGS